MRSILGTCAYVTVAFIALCGHSLATDELVREVKFLPGVKERMSIIIPRIQEPVNVNGKLDDAVWRSAVVIEKLRPFPKESPQEAKARVLLMFDQQNLYVGMQVYGEDVQKLGLAEQKKPDVWGGRMAEIFLGPRGDEKGIYHFCQNAIGTRYDASATNGASWQGQWLGKGSVYPDHWEVQMAFPFTDFGIKGQPEGMIWLANFAVGGSTGTMASWTGGWGDLAGMGLVFFGMDPYQSQRKPVVSVILDREEYDPLDVTGVAILKVEIGPCAPVALADARVLLELVDEPGNVVQKQVITSLKTRLLDITLGLQDVPLGNYRLRATLEDKNGKALTSTEAVLRKKVRRTSIAPPKRQQVTLNVWPVAGMQTAGNQLAEWPISTGVPFPQGALLNESQVRLLDEAGKEVPCQTMVRSLWNRQGSVRWLGLDFQAAMKPEGAKYLIEFGSDVQRAQTKTDLKVVDEPGQIGGDAGCLKYIVRKYQTMRSLWNKQADQKVVDEPGQISVDTGRLKFIVRKRGFNLLDEVRLDGKLVSRQGKDDGLVIVDHMGNVYRASNDPQTVVTVEESGPVRVTLRVEGWYVKDGTQGETISPDLPTDRLCRYVTRISAYQGKPYVSVQHDLIITFNTQHVRLRNIGISQHIKGADRALFGLDGKGVEVTPLPASARLYQASSEAAQVEVNDAGQVVRAGRRGDGWTRLSSPTAGLTLCVTDPWQLFPKEVEVAGGSLWLHVWPKHGRPYTGVNPLDLGEIYKLWWCHTGAELNFSMPDDVYATLKKSAHYKDNGGADVENGRVANAQGVAIENNFLLAFDTGTATAGDAQAINAVYQTLPHAWPDTKWVCDSMVFGWMTPKDDAKFYSMERFFEYSLWQRVAAQEFARDYGQFNYFDIHSDNSSFAQGRWGLDRVWNQGHHGDARFPWYLYARSGDPRYLQFARRLSRHVMNVDVIHYATSNYDLFQGLNRPQWPNLDHVKGAMYHVKGFAHWGGDSALAGHLINYDHILWDYYVTGNRRGLDVVMEWSEGIKELAPGGYSGREGTQTTAELTELYKATFDPKILMILDASAFRPLHDGPFAKQHALNFAPFLERYLPFTGSQAYRDKAKEWVTQTPWGRSYGLSGNVAATLYYETGDISYLKSAMPIMFFCSLRWDPRPIKITLQDRISTYMNVGYDIQYWQPFLRALVDAGIPLDIPPQVMQDIPDGCTIHFRKDNDRDVPLTFVYRAKPKSLEVTVVRPDGNAALTVALPGNTNMEDYCKEPVRITNPRDGMTGDYTVRLGAWQDRVDFKAVTVPFTQLPTVLVVKPDARASFFENQMWYFRGVPGQTTLELKIPSIGREGGIQITTADGKKVLGQVGLVGQESAIIKFDLQPGETYRLITHQEGSNANIITPVKYPLVLARTPEEWFVPNTK